MNDGWKRVSALNPCPVCGKRDWCCISMTTGATLCMRMPSDREANGGGWLHGGTERPAMPIKPPTPVDDAPAFNAKLWWQAVRVCRSLDKLTPWAEQLGLPVDDMDFMGAATLNNMLTFPMYDGTGEICGIRTRLPTGEKKSITGSKSGVFLPCMHLDLGYPPLICEGPTDSVAALALKFEPIGRPSCRGCEQQVIDTCKRMGYERVTLCADADGPGISGAQKLVEMLRFQGIAVRMVTPYGFKDLREWFRAGVSQNEIDLAWSQAEWR